MTPTAQPLSRDEFLGNLRDSGLFSPEELATQITPWLDPLEPDGEVLARRLVAAEKLTAFQAAAVRQRHFEQLVIGHYQVLDRLGAGGMGTVYKARHRRMKRVVAIKVLSRSAGLSETFLQRFQREVEAVARLSHPHIVLAHDAGEAALGHYLVMEFVDGRDLTAEVEQRGPLPLGEAVAYTLQAARALDYAHRQGVIHRDVKPANLLRDPSGQVKLADLGLARFHDPVGRSPAESGALTQAGTLMGTVDFMSPEQALGAPDIDHRADIYSLGCTLHYLLLGRPPYQGPTMMAVLLGHRDGPISSLKAARGDIPPALDQVFRRMVAKKPADRFTSMADVVRALEALPLGPGPQTGPPPEPPAAPPAATAPTLITTALNDDTTPATASTPAEDDLGFDLGPADTAAEVSGKVVLVEPSRTQSAIIRRYLQAQGVADVIAVASGREALQVVQRERPAAVISALHLADMTGVQLAQQLGGQGQAAGPGFVLISSAAESSEAGTLSKYGKGVVLQKPFSPEQLGQALKLVAGRLQLAKPSSPPPPPHPYPSPPGGERGRGEGVAPDRGRLRVLIVDDSAPARLHIRRVLEGLGLTQLVTAADGARAVAEVARQTFDLIVTDYNMPLMDGAALVGYLRQNPATASVPVIMVTTETDPDKLAAVRALGVAAICQKSFPPEEVRPILDALVPRS
jgi:serine/threonine protein kinase/CheY-like chemotaxis protein